MSELHAPQDDPTSDAAQKVSSYLTLALAAAQAAVQRATLRAHRQARPQPDEPDDLGLADARARWAPLLGPDAPRVSTRTALDAWTSAQPHRDRLPDAEQAAAAAETRLRALHPQAMGRYDALRRGLTPEDAMREVTPLLLPGPDPTTTRGMTSQPPTTGRSGVGEDLPARYAPVVRGALPAKLADRVLAERAWPRLAAALHAAEQAGADPGRLLRAVAAERELGTARSAAQVLHSRLAARTPASTAAASYPTPLTPTSRTPASASEEGERVDRSLSAAGRRLEREADTELANARTADRTPDDPTTQVDEHAQGLADGQAHTTTAAGLHAAAQAQAGESASTGPPTRTTAAATAARSYPTPPGAATPPTLRAPAAGAPPAGLPAVRARGRRN